MTKQQDPKSCYNCHHATYHPGTTGGVGYLPEEAWFYCAQEDEAWPAHVIDKDIAEGSEGCPCWTPEIEPLPMDIDDSKDCYI